MDEITFLLDNGPLTLNGMGEVLKTTPSRVAERSFYLPPFSWCTEYPLVYPYRNLETHRAILKIKKTHITLFF